MDGSEDRRYIWHSLSQRDTTSILTSKNTSQNFLFLLFHLNSYSIIELYTFDPSTINAATTMNNSIEQHKVLLHGEGDLRIAIDDDGLAVTNSFIDAERHPMQSRKNSVIRKRRDHTEKRANPTNEIEGMKKPYVDSPPQSPRLIPAASSDTVEKYKQLIRVSMVLPADGLYEDVGRSQDFLGKSEILELDRNAQESLGFVSSSPKSSPNTRNSRTLQQKWGKPDLEDDTQARPSAWLGSPSTKRMSYRIKEKVNLDLITEFPPPEDQVTPKQIKPKFEALESPSSVPTGDRRSVFKNPTGAYNKMMSASDSHLLSPRKTENLEKYKAMIRSRNFPPSDGVYEDIGRSQQFLGQSEIIEEKLGRSAQESLGYSASIPVTSPKPGSPKSHHHNWGAPDPEDATQARPTEWLGSPSSGRRKSYRIKNGSNLEVAPPPPMSMSSPTTVLAPPYDKKVMGAGTPPRTPVATKETIGGKRFSALYQVFESPAP
jgi:hypothetical protein